MILSAHQPAYMPWLGLFHKIALSDAFIILDAVQFEKNSFINRNRIKTPRGSLWLTVPVFIKGHTHKTILEIEINNTTNWRKRHWKTVYLNYKKAPYFSKYSDFFENLYKKEWVRLYDLLDHSFRYFIKELGIQTPIHRQSDLNIHSKKELLIIDLCKKFNAREFIFGSFGKDYVNVDVFKESGINSIFQDYIHPVYPQLWGDFISHLSVIDLLFNVGAKNTLEIIMSKNIAKKQLQEIPDRDGRHT